MSDVKVSKTKSGMYQMTGKSNVCTFDQFIKAPDEFTKGQTVPGDAKVKSEAGDKDYKQLLMESANDGRVLTFEDWTAAQAVMESEGESQADEKGQDAQEKKEGAETQKEETESQEESQKEE